MSLQIRKYFLSLLLVTLLLVYNNTQADAKEIEIENSDTEELSTNYQVPFTEWVALGLGGGTHGVGLKLSLFTFRIPNFAASVIQIHIFGAAPGRWEGKKKVLFTFGPMFSYPLVASKDGAHEFRFGLMPGFSVNYHGTKSIESECATFLCGKSNTQSMYGFSLTPDITYIFRTSRHYAFQASINAHIIVVGAHSCGLFCTPVNPNYAWPGVFFTLGFHYGS